MAASVDPPRPYEAARWAPGPHLQTLGARLLRPLPELPLRRERLGTPDGDFLLLDLAFREEEEGPVVVVLHGLEGSSRRRYVLLACRELRARGLRPVAMNFRTCGGELNRTHRFYHSGETGDLRLLLREAARRWPGVPLGALGFSLGGNVLLKHLGEEGGDPAPALSAAVAISVPFDLAAGAHRLESGPMGRLYTAYFLRTLRRKLAAKAELVRDRCDLERALRAPTLRGFDDAATAPLHGFAGAADYYRHSSSARYLDGIRVPTLVLHAEDDPFLPAPAIPRRALEGNPSVTAVIPPRGGHVGFLEGPGPWAPGFWAEEEAAAFLGRRLREEA